MSLAALTPLLQTAGTFGGDFLGGGGAGAPLLSDAGDGDFNFTSGGSFAVGSGAQASTGTPQRAPQFATAGLSGGGLGAVLPVALLGLVAWAALR